MRTSPGSSAGASARQLRARDQPCCPLCGSRGSRCYGALRDRLLGRPERWSFARCDAARCGLVWLDPQPVQADIALAYQGGYYTHLGSAPRSGLIRRLHRTVERGYLATALGYGAPEIRQWQRLAGRALGWFPLSRAEGDFRAMHLAARPGGRLLEIGCGSGASLDELRALGWNVEGLDFDAAAVAAARRRGLNVRSGTLGEQRYAEASFDAIVMSHVIEHLFDPAWVIQECARLLSPDGRLVVVTPNTASLFHRRFGASWFPLDPPRHIMLFHARLLGRLIERSGLSIERLATSVRGARPNWTLSRRIARDGVADLYRPPSLRERIAAYLAALAEWVFCLMSPESGEEVVLVARKERC